MILVTWRCSELQTLLHHTMVSLHENYLSVVMGMIIIGWYFFTIKIMHKVLHCYKSDTFFKDFK